MSAIAATGEQVGVPNYVVAESLALIGRRLGMEAARAVQRRAIAPSRILWTTPIEHARAVEAFLESGKSLSFVDCATMVTMRTRGLTRIFAFDDDFRRAGFEVVPAR